MSDKKLDSILEKLASIESTLGSRISLLDVRLSGIDARLASLEENMRKVLKCVDHENADFNPMDGVDRKLGRKKMPA